MEVYFDNSATTKVYPEVKDIMFKVMDEDYGNPSSLHMKGVQAEHYHLLVFIEHETRDNEV